MTLTPEQTRRFHHHVDGLNKLLQELRESTMPDANYYLDGDGLFHLLSGDSHDVSAFETKSRQDRVVASHPMPHAGGGGW